MPKSVSPSLSSAAILRRSPWSVGLALGLGAVCALSAPAAAQDQTSDDVPTLRITVSVNRTSADRTSGEQVIPGADVENTDDLFGASGLAFRQMFTLDDFIEAYPRKASRRRQGGEADLNCTIQVTGRLECTVTREEPRGWRFGQAAMSLAQKIQVAPYLADGSPSAGIVVNIPFTFDPN